jgi:hexosaminidase
MPAELARYRALGIGYADSAFAPAFAVTASSKGMLNVTLSNQANFGEIRYTTGGSAPTSTSTLYVRPLEFPAEGKVTLRAATFAPGSFDLAAPRTQVLDASTLLSRDSSALAPCSKQEEAMRLDGKQPAQGWQPTLGSHLSPGSHPAHGLDPAQRLRPVYRVTVGDMCWLWRSASLQDSEQVTLTVERIAWRFGDEAKEAVVRPKASAAGEFEIHADSCAGPLLARLPLAPAAQEAGQNQLSAKVSASKPNDARDLCIFATGDPRDGQWVLARVAFSK